MRAERGGQHEWRRRKPVIHTVFGPHGDEYTNHLVHFDDAIRQSLQSSSGKIIVFVEDGFASERQAKSIESKIDQGIPPSYSYALEYFIAKHHRLPDTKNDAERDMIAAFASGPGFRNKELAIIDHHFTPDLQFEPVARVKVLWESKPEEQIKEASPSDLASIESYNEILNESVSAVLAGNFDEGIPPYKRFVDTMADESTKRDERLADRIAKEAEDEDVGAIVGYRGSGHTRLSHILGKKGFTVKRTFTEKEDGVVVWDPTNDAIRKKELIPGRELSELEWYRHMVGETILRVVEDGVKRSGKNMSEQHILEVVNLGLTQFADMEKIRNFEQKIREEGFNKALQSTA